MEKNGSVGENMNVIRRNYELVSSKDTTCIIVMCIPAEMKEEELATIFSKYGKIKNVKVVRDPVTRRSKRHAFISFLQVSAAKASVEMDGFKCNDGNVFSVRLAPLSIRPSDRHSPSRYRIRSSSFDQLSDFGFDIHNPDCAFQLPIDRLTPERPEDMNLLNSIKINRVSPVTTAKDMFTWMNYIGPVWRTFMFPYLSEALVTFVTREDALKAVAIVDKMAGGNGQILRAHMADTCLEYQNCQKKASGGKGGKKKKRERRHHRKNMRSVIYKYTRNQQSKASMNDTPTNGI